MHQSENTHRFIETLAKRKVTKGCYVRTSLGGVYRLIEGCFLLGRFVVEIGADFVDWFGSFCDALQQRFGRRKAAAFQGVFAAVLLAVLGARKGSFKVGFVVVLMAYCSWFGRLKLSFQQCILEISTGWKTSLVLTK